MHELMSEVRSWKRQNERRLRELSASGGRRYPNQEPTPTHDRFGLGFRVRVSLRSLGLEVSGVLSRRRTTG